MNRLKELTFIWSQTFGLLRKAAPRLTIAVNIVTLVEGIASLGVLYMVKLLSDAISHSLASPEAGSDRILILIGLTGCAIVATVLLQSIGNVLRLRQGLAVSEFVDSEIHDQAISLDLQFYESPKYYDALEQARHGGAQRPAQVVSNIILMLRAGIVLLGVLVLLTAIDPLLMPILLLPVLLGLFVRTHHTRKMFHWRMARIQLERRTRHLDWLLTSAAHAKELRLNRIGGYFRDRYRSLRDQMAKGLLSMEVARLATDFAVSVIGAVVFIAASAWLLQRALMREIPIGDVVLFVLLLRRADSSGNEFVGNISRTVDDHLYLRRLFEFLSMKPVIGTANSPRPIPDDIKDGVRLNNVSFKYDGAEGFALENASLQIRPGQIVALVGENGSGKTTLIKLLTRLYEPTTGSVTLDEEDIRTFEPNDYRRLFSVIFQDYAMYAAPAADNIRFGDVELPESVEAVQNAARRAGASAFIERLPQSYDTPLTKLFDDGHDLSVGQWQRLALARSFYPLSKFIILDEPTSAVDPKAEFELFDQFRERIGGRGALLISHRLSTVRLADYTYVLEAGRIAEHGTHQDLMAARGKYAELFDKQAQYYR